jgi:hypothetical protein
VNSQKADEKNVDGKVDGYYTPIYTIDYIRNINNYSNSSYKYEFQRVLF